MTEQSKNEITSVRTVSILLKAACSAMSAKVGATQLA